MEEIPKDQEINPSDQPPGTGVNLSLNEIEALKGRIEQQKANKLKAEQIVSTLSRIKAREKASRKSGKPGEKKIDDCVSSQPPKRSGTNSSNALKEKSNLLKKKLEEDRAKFESKKGQEDLGRVSQIVEHIRVQLEDQDKTIQQIHSNFAATTKLQPSHEKEAPAELDIPPEVKQRIADLEMKILDLQENLREKDSVISARTQAITLLSEDMARKGKNTLDTLEETRSQMKTMQANFVALEDRMNEERSRLREELEAKKIRLQQLEKNYRAAESARFDLSTRVAELQEKVVTLQTKNIALEEEVTEANKKVKELTDALDNNNKHLAKLKAQYKSKLKSLEEERDMLKKEERTNEELNRLRERIADLEDEKEAGNLLKERIAEMEEKLLRQECDLDSHIKAITKLEAEKLDLIEATRDNAAVLKDKEDMIQLLQTQLTNLQELKITAEMKCLELEEKLDSYIKTEKNTNQLSIELENTKHKLAEHQNTITELKCKLETKNTILSSNFADTTELEGTNSMKRVEDLSSSLIELDNRNSQLEEKLNQTLAICNMLEDQKKSVESDNERLINECQRLKETIEKLTYGITKSETSVEDVNLLKQALAQKDDILINVNNHNKTLETEVENLRLALQSTTSELHQLYEQVEELKSTQQKIEELSTNLEIKDKEVEERSRKLSEYKKFHKLKCEDVLRISHELETVTSSFQLRITELEESLSTAQQTESELRREIKELKESTIKDPESIETKFQEQCVKMKKLAANIKLKTKLIKDLEAKIEEQEKILQEKEILIHKSENEKLNLQQKFCEVDFSQNELSQLQRDFQEKVRVLECELSSLKEELDTKTKELEYFKTSLNDKDNTYIQIKELENQNKKLTDISEVKTDQINKMEDEISTLNGMNKSLLSELEQMQETYKLDALKNESVLDGFEHEMLGNKKDILELSNQLKDVTSKYEQTWAKLQEKEGYVEELEENLERVKVRLLQIESTVEDRRRSLEERAEMLGARLCQAEKNNEVLEKHKGELEQKIAYLFNTEEMLGNALEKLQEENNEISRSLTEATNENLRLSQELNSEQAKVLNLNKKLQDLQISLTNYEQVVEDYENIKAQLKESQDSRDNQIKFLEKRFSESEQYMEIEVKRLMDRINLVECERQEVIDKCNSLTMEKQVLEEEFHNLQQTIVDITKEEFEDLKNNHKLMSEQLNKEIDKRELYIHKIQELEEEILKQKELKPVPSSNVSAEQELLKLKNQLLEEIKEKEKLQYELLREKAKQQVDDVLFQAKETYFTMSENTVTNTESSNSIKNNLTHFGGFSEVSSQSADEVSELKKQLSNLNTENNDLKHRLQELECRGRNLNENDNDDWAATNKDEDDGWGWGSKDAMLEHEYVQKQQVLSDLEAKVMESEKVIFTINEENKRLAEELKATQSKCGKLLKKVKEFKNKNDDLERNSRERSVGFDDLDIAMQEELKSQVDKLEKNLQECSVNVKSLQIERENLIKRIDTLTSGNEKLIEMKERQDIEVEMWQRRSNDLQNKIQALEWTIAELQAEQAESKQTGGNISYSEEEKQHLVSNALEMEEKLNILAAENDYLQSLIVELKDKDKIHNASLNVAPNNNNVIENAKLEISSLMHSQLEKDNLNDASSLLGEQLIRTSEIATECPHKVENLAVESQSLPLKKEYSKQHSNTTQYSQTLVDQCNQLRSENEYLLSVIHLLQTKLNELRHKYDFIQNELSNDEVIKAILEKEQFGKFSESRNPSQELVEPNLTLDESPTLFKGFSSVDDNLFGVSLDSFGSGIQHPGSSTTQSHPFGFPMTFEDKDGELEPNCVKTELSRNSSTRQTNLEDIVNEIPSAESYSAEVANLKKALSEKDSEIRSLSVSLTIMEKENMELKLKIEGIGTGNLRESSEDLRGRCNTSGNIFGNENPFNNIDIDDGSVFSNAFLQLDDDQESQINKFVEQITKLTKTLHDKEVEIEALTERKNKYKEMYYGLAKDFDDQSRDQSTADKDQLTDQNTMLNQLLEDKETELEIMSQQIDQTIAAKENLQDELSMKLSEMEAANQSFTHTLSKELLLSPTQPENIEEVRTLCAEIAELTKLLQEKESEFDSLKQQFDESNLEKENLRVELKKAIEKCEENNQCDSRKAEEMEKELQTFKDVIVADIEKQLKDEVSLKDQQLMNALNDLHNMRSFCQDLQTKLLHLEENYKACCSQNELVMKELTELEQAHDTILPLRESIHQGLEMTVVERVKKLKENLCGIKDILDQTRTQVEEKDSIISNFNGKIKLIESNVDNDEKPIDEQVYNSSKTKTFTSETFRFSTEQSSSDDDSSLRNLEASHSQSVLMKEIESLRQVLSMKDAEITRMSIALNEAQENLIRGEMRFINSEEESLRQRLDEALYTLHLRDVRCDELTLELMQLLEERDSLQLRLSTAIRFNEELREKSNLLDEAATSVEATSSLIKEDDRGNDQQLRQKLDQLHSLGYRRDPEMQQDQQRRHQEHMHLYTHHTAQDDSNQSSGGFFNWIFGSSPSGSQDV